MNRNVSGIYTITHTASGKRYVGSAVNLQKRFNKHRSELRSGKHPSPTLTASWNKYGESAFEFLTLLRCSKENLLFFEQRAMDVLKPKFNIRLVAMSNIGLKFSDEFRAKMSQRLLGNAYTLGYKHSEESKAKMKAFQKSRIRSPEIGKKIGAAKLGVKLSPSHCLNIRKSKANVSAETRMKQRLAKLGKALSTEARLKRASLMNKTYCPQGHEYTKENTGLYGRNRVCKLCRRARSLARYYKIKPNAPSQLPLFRQTASSTLGSAPLSI